MRRLSEFEGGVHDQEIDGGPPVRAFAPEGHEIPDGAPLKLAVGEVVEAGGRHDHWPAFVLVTSPDGSGWVPSRHLSADRGPVTVTEAYNTTELALPPGAEVTVVSRDDESGWWWCRRDDGSEGWVPVEALEPIDPAP